MLFSGVPIVVKLAVSSSAKKVSGIKVFRGLKFSMLCVGFPPLGALSSGIVGCLFVCFA